MRSYYEREVGKTGGRSSQLHVWVWQQILTNFFLFPFPLSCPPVFPTSHLVEKSEVGGTGGHWEEEKGKRKNLLKFLSNPNSQLHARVQIYHLCLLNM